MCKKGYQNNTGNSTSRAVQRRSPTKSDHQRENANLKKKNLKLFVDECEKIVLSSVNNTRYMTEGHETQAFGHHKVFNTNILTKSTITKESLSLLVIARDFIVKKTHLSG